VTASIHALYEQAARAKDYAAQAMLQWFVTEQVEEEATARTILEEAERIGDGSTALYFFDRHLGKDAGKDA
jgi:ferritin